MTGKRSVSSSDYDSEESQQRVAPQVDRANILNYQSDSSDYDPEDDSGADYHEPIANNVQAFNRAMNAKKQKHDSDEDKNLWGKKKGGYYAGEKSESGSENSSAEED